ncbi:uncharacterized protein LOC119911258 [Micropterus salmoides]|uniref:uncharacterized protein LOC119911258 n=1 Tax=Micropterus salmoides TaxID=27706 RepID=UPI0018EBE1B8|nr:uncharacterized protein LOC119911258 [Micropterus salmoides]
MSRRSSRLVSGGYYNSDEESDSSSVTNISYRENPVKVFKKKAGTRKAGSRTPSRANSNAISASAKPPITASQYDGLSPSPASSQTEPTMRTVPYISTMATPRPALTPSSARSQTPTCCPSVSPEKSSSSSRPESHLKPSLKEQSQSTVDSSGYSSSEGTHRKPTSAATSSGRRISGAPSSGYGSRISSAFFSLMDSISLMAIAVQSKIMHLASLANTSFSSHTKKACGLLLLLLIILICIWFLLPLLTSLISRMMVTKPLSQTKPESQPVILAIPSPQLNTVHPTPVVDPAIVSAVVEAKMQHLMEELQLKQNELQLKQERFLSQNPSVVSAAVEAKMQRVMEELQLKQNDLQLKQERLLSQVKERFQQDIQDMKAKLEVVDSDSRLRLEQELARLGMQMVDYQTDSRSAAASLSLSLQALEAQTTKLSQEWSSFKLMPPAAPVLIPVPTPSTTVSPQSSSRPWRSGSLTASRNMMLSGSVTKEAAQTVDVPWLTKLPTLH